MKKVCDNLTEIINPAPIILFVYNRLWHTQHTIEALQKNVLADQSDLIIYSDAPKNDQAWSSVQEVRDYIKTVDGFKSIKIVERDKNWGLAANIIDGVTEVVNQYGKIIVVEDDIVTSPAYLSFMNQTLSRFQNNEEIMSISGYLYPIDVPVDYKFDLIKFYRGSSWGWATWKEQWDLVDFDLESIFKKHPLSEIKKINRGGNDLFSMLVAQRKGKINSWAIRFALSHSLNNKVALFPAVSFATNIGHDNSGTHCGEDSHWVVPLSEKRILNWDTPPEDKEINRLLLKNFNRSFFNLILNKIKKILGV